MKMGPGLSHDVKYHFVFDQTIVVRYDKKVIIKKVNEYMRPFYETRGRWQSQ